MCLRDQLAEEVVAVVPLPAAPVRIQRLVTPVRWACATSAAESTSVFAHGVTHNPLPCTAERSRALPSTGTGAGSAASATAGAGSAGGFAVPPLRGLVGQPLCGKAGPTGALARRAGAGFGLAAGDGGVTTGALVATTSRTGSRTGSDDGSELVDIAIELTPPAVRIAITPTAISRSGSGVAAAWREDTPVLRPEEQRP